MIQLSPEVVFGFLDVLLDFALSNLFNAISVSQCRIKDIFVDDNVEIFSLILCDICYIIPGGLLQYDDLLHKYIHI